MFTSAYALRESTSKASSLKKKKNRESSKSSAYSPSASIYSSDFYTAQDPQYYQQGSTSSCKMPKKSKRGRKSSKYVAGASTVASDSAMRNHVVQIGRPGANDVLCGRGGDINKHPGNIAFRALVHDKKHEYNLDTNKSSKAAISQSIIDAVHSLEPPGRFLIKDKSTFGSRFWIEVENDKAVAKTSQALREGAPKIRAIAAEKQVKSVPGTKSLQTLGKRNRRSINRHTNDDVTKQEEETEYKRPSKCLKIVAMGNGHRGKEITRCSSSNVLETKLDEKPARINPSCVSVDSVDSLVKGDIRVNQKAESTSMFEEDHSTKIVSSSGVAARSTIQNDPFEGSADSSPQSSKMLSTNDSPPRTLTLSPQSSKMPSNMPIFDEGPVVSSPQSFKMSSTEGICMPMNLLSPPKNVLFSRAHSLVSTEINGVNDIHPFQGDEPFIDPFLNDSNGVEGESDSISDQINSVTAKKPSSDLMFLQEDH